MRFQWVIGLGVPVIGCSGGDGSKDPIKPPIQDSTPETGATGDTAPERNLVDAAYYAISARFAYDPETATHLGFASAGGGLTPIQLIVTLIDSSAATTLVVDAENSCSVTLEVDGSLPVAPWVAENGAWTGFDVPSGATVRDGCVDYDLPVEFEGEAGRHVAKWGYGVGIGPLDPETVARLRATLPDSEWAALEPFAVGGALSSNTQPGYATGLGIGYEVDGNFEVVVDGVGNPEPIAREQIDQETGVARGYYEAAMGQYGPGVFLTGEP